MKLKKFLACAITCCAAFNAAAKDADSTTLSFHNVKTDESLVIRHTRGQPVSPETNHFMRDWRKNQPANIDPRLLDLLVDLQSDIKARHPGLKITFEIICAFRNQQTNQMLSDASAIRNGKNGKKGKPSQAGDSRHLYSQAFDLRIPGLPLKELRDRATCLKAGGVGYYPSTNDNFVHVDVGGVRYWPSRAYLPELKCD